MSWTWFIYTPLSAREALDVQDELEQLLEAWTDERGEDGAEELLETCGQLGGGGPLPSRDDVLQTNASFGHPVDPIVLERLPRCRSSIAIDRVCGTGLEHPLQVSILRFLVERTGESLVDWGDHQIVPSERVLADLKKLRSRGRLGAPPSAAPKPVRRRKQRPGEVRSVRIAIALERSADDPDLAIDLERVLAAMSEVQRRYVALLVNDGAMDDAKAASLLGVALRDLEPELERLDAALGKLAP